MRFGQDHEARRRVGAPEPRVQEDRVHGAYSLGMQRLPGKLHAAALVHLEQLDLDDVALLHDILGLLGAAVLQLADVEQALDARNDLHEGAERRRALDRPLVHPSDLGLGHDGGDHLAGLLARLAADGRDGDEAAVVHVDLGAGGVLDPADRLALRDRSRRRSSPA